MSSWKYKPKQTVTVLRQIEIHTTPFQSSSISAWQQGAAARGALRI